MIIHAKKKFANIYCFLNNFTSYKKNYELQITINLSSICNILLMNIYRNINFIY